MSQSLSSGFESAAMQQLSLPTLIAVDIGADAAPPPHEGTILVVDIQNGRPLVIGGGWPAPILLRQPPALLVAILAGEVGDRLAGLLHWLREIDATSMPPVIPWRHGHEDEAIAEATRTLARHLGRSAASHSETVREAMRLRDANTELAYRFAVAECALHRRDALPVTVAFTNEPVTEQAEFDVLNETPGGVVQVLPTASNGVAALALHFSRSEPAGAALDVRLQSLEDDRLIEQWLVPSQEIQPGWNVFGLSRAVSGQDRTLELRLKRTGADERLPLLSLGAGQPIADFHVRHLAGRTTIIPRSLALQLWTSLPGTKLAPSIEAHRPLRRTTRQAGFVERPITQQSLKAVELANEEAVSFDFRPVWAPPGENTATCHPPSHGVTLGRLPDAVPPGAIKVSASLNIGDNKSNDIDFAMVVADQPARALQILKGGSTPAASEAFSGWVRIASNRPGRLSAFRAEPGRPDNLFIATRMSTPGDNSYAQARFKDFSVMVQE